MLKGQSLDRSGHLLPSSVCPYGSAVSMSHALSKSIPHRGPRALQPCPGSSPLAEAISAQILCLLDQVLWRLWALEARIPAPSLQGSVGAGVARYWGFTKLHSEHVSPLRAAGPVSFY